MPIVQWHATWDVLSGKEEEYVAWMLNTFRPFWKRQPGLTTFRGFWTLVGGSPSYVAEFDCDDLAALARILEQPEWAEIQAQLRSLTSSYESRILVPTGRGDDPA